MLVLDNSSRAWRHHSCGVFTNQAKRTAFEFKEEDGTVSADILQVDARFTSLLRWLGKPYQRPIVRSEPRRRIRGL